MNLSNEYIRQHIVHGDIDACFDVMHRIIHFATDDKELIAIAKSGEMKRDLSVTDREATRAEGRKKFLINILNRCTYMAENKNLHVHLKANFRVFCFNAARLGLGDEFELIGETMIKKEQ